MEAQSKRSNGMKFHFPKYRQYFVDTFLKVAVHFAPVSPASLDFRRRFFSLLSVSTRMKSRVEEKNANVQIGRAEGAFPIYGKPHIQNVHITLPRSFFLPRVAAREEQLSTSCEFASKYSSERTPFSDVSITDKTYAVSVRGQWMLFHFTFDYPESSPIFFSTALFSGNLSIKRPHVLLTETKTQEQ